MFSQIIRFTLPPALTISAPAFLKLRQSASAAGAAAQYYGYTTVTPNAPLPRKRHEICWVIQWPDAHGRSALMAELNAISTGDATSLLLKFDDAQLAELGKALESPVCEFACIRLSDEAPLSDSALQTSMHKTYTDAYKMRGFTGGQWAYAINTNETRGVPCSDGAAMAGAVPEGAQRLGVYYLGWESIELHQDGTLTEAFTEELTKLAPYCGPGTGAWYATFRKY